MFLCISVWERIDGKRFSRQFQIWLRFAPFCEIQNNRLAGIIAVRLKRIILHLLIADFLSCFGNHIKDNSICVQIILPDKICYHDIFSGSDMKNISGTRFVQTVNAKRQPCRRQTGTIQHSFLIVCLRTQLIKTSLCFFKGSVVFNRCLICGIGRPCVQVRNDIIPPFTGCCMVSDELYTVRTICALINRLILCFNEKNLSSFIEFNAVFQRVILFWNLIIQNFLSFRYKVRKFGKSDRIHKMRF